jgi:hypothetical protein
MTDLPYWGIAAALVWICTRDLSYIQMLQTGDAGGYEKPTALDISLVLAKFQQNEKRPNVMSKEQAKAELLAKLRTGELKARGVKCDPFNKGNAISDTAQDIPATDWMDLRLDSCPPNSGGHSDGRYAAFFEHNWYPSWRRVRCLSATAQQLWPTERGSARPLSDREKAVRAFLEDWQVRADTKAPYYGAQAAAFRHVANTFNCSVGAVKQSIRAFVADEIRRLSKARHRQR